jgi:LCP family protein required for cell wall assembly
MDERDDRAEGSGLPEEPAEQSGGEWIGEEHQEEPEGRAEGDPGDDGGDEDSGSGEDSSDEPVHGDTDELQRIVSAETAEWTPEDVEPEQPEAESGGEDEGEQGEAEDEEGEAEGDQDDDQVAEPAAGAEAEQTLVVPGEAAPGWRERGSSALAASFGWLGRGRFPLWARFLLASLLIVGSFAAATTASLRLYLTDIAEALGHGPNLDGVEDRLDPPDPGEPQTILVVGSDLQPVGNTKRFKGLSDTTMLVRLDPERDAIALFSLPRDLKVQIPGYGTDRLNVAYTLGGPKLTLKTVQRLTASPERPEGLSINHLVNVDFTGFARAVNAIDCVYVDVDRRYFHSNDFTSGAGDYDEINIRPGYQALCGMNALDYVRYRHTDNDVVRAARQQDFLREARQKVPVSRLISDRKDLIKIFTEHTTSDIDEADTMIEVFKLFLASRDAPIKEIHFEGHLGPSYVTATHAQINKAVNQFLGIEDTPGARGKDARPDEPVVPEGKDESTPATGGSKKEGNPSLASLGLVATGYGKPLARGIRAQRPKSDLTIFYPTLLEARSDFEQKPRVYKINGTGRGSPPRGERAAYKWVFSRPLLGEYFGLMGTAWRDPPILENPSEEREFGDRTYKLYYAGDRLRLIAWQDDHGSYWISNTLIQSLNTREMIEIARAMRELPPPKRPRR